MMIRINIKHIWDTVNIDLIRVKRKHISLRMVKGCSGFILSTFFSIIILSYWQLFGQEINL